MKKEVTIVVIAAVLGSTSTVGFDILKSKYLKTEEPLSKGVTELTHIRKELILEQKALDNRITSISSREDIPAELKVEFGDIISRVNNIVQTSVHFEAKSRDVTDIVMSVKNRNEHARFNANADLILSYGQAVTVCGNENTLGIESYLGRDAIIYLNGIKKSASVGQEFKFMSPMGPSMVSYLGKNAEKYDFRIVCGTQVKKI